MRILFLILILPFFVLAKAKETEPIKIKVVFMEALAPKDTTSSERFQKEYEFAIQTGKNFTREELKKCGYILEEEKIFYDASDALQSLEETKKAKEKGAWLIVGPRRSNHYLLLVKGAPDMATLSIMASSQEVFDLDSLHLTLAQSNKNMAEVAAKEVVAQNKKIKTYLSIVSEDCVTCVDFAAHFDKKAKSLGLKNIKEIKIFGEEPNISEYEKHITDSKPDFILLPNYSKVSSSLMATIHKWSPKTMFVGGDGWGDSKYGFVSHSPELENVQGLTVKGFPPVDKGLLYFKLGKTILKNPSLAAAFPASGSAQALLKTIEGIATLLCQHKPKSKDEFTKIFKQAGKKYFSNPWGTSVFKLTDGEIVFNKTVK